MLKTPYLGRSTPRLLLLALAPALVLSACAGGAANQETDGGAAGSDNEPIRVAVVSPHSGPYADFGALQRAGFQFAADEANAKGGIDGRKVELFVTDSLGTTEGAVAGADRMVRQNNAHFIVGPIATTETLAVVQRLASWDAVQLGVQSQGDALTGESCSPRFFRTNMSDHMAVRGLVTWLEQNPIKDWDAISADYAFGHDSAEGLVNAAKESGWTVDKNIFAPLGTADYASYISQLNGGEGLLVNLSGGDSVNFFKQALEFGKLKEYENVIGHAALTSSTLKAVKSPELVGMYGTANWVPTVDTAGTKAFVEAYKAKNSGQEPQDFTGAAYMAMQTLFAAVDKAGSIDPKTVAKTLNGLTFESIKGTVTMRAEDHQMEAPMYIGQVEETDAGLELVSKAPRPIEETMPQADANCKMAPLQ